MRPPWHGLRSNFRARRTTLARLARSGRVVVGAETYGDPAIYVYGGDDTRLLLGAYVSIARGVTFVLGGNHRVDSVTTFPLRIRFDLPGKYEDGNPWSRGDVVVGSDVWFGANCLVLSGVTIGHGAVLAAGAVVTSDIPPYSIAAGSPATPRRLRFSPHQIDALLRIAWWDWPNDQVRSRAADLSDLAVDEFIEKYSYS